MDNGKLSRIANALAAIRTQISQLKRGFLLRKSPVTKGQRAKGIGQNILHRRLVGTNDDIFIKDYRDAASSRAEAIVLMALRSCGYPKFGSGRRQKPDDPVAFFQQP